jgi:hypothetical protein
MQSDWGSAFPKQEVNYVIAAQNTRASGDMRDMLINSAMPANLEVLSASASYGSDPNLKSIDPVVAGNQVSLKLDRLKPGEQVFIAIKTRVKADVDISARIVSQAELTFTGIRSTAFSNFVTVLVVGAAPTAAQVAQAQAATATTAPAAATSPAATATASATAAASATPTETPAPSPTDSAAPPAAQPSAGAQVRSTAPLPETSAGIPIFGFAMLGMTLMLRTVRIHRAQSRI